MTQQRIVIWKRSAGADPSIRKVDNMAKSTEGAPRRQPSLGEMTGTTDPMAPDAVAALRRAIDELQPFDSDRHVEGLLGKIRSLLAAEDDGSVEKADDGRVRLDKAVGDMRDLSSKLAKDSSVSPELRARVKKSQRMVETEYLHQHGSGGIRYWEAKRSEAMRKARSAA